MDERMGTFCSVTLMLGWGPYSTNGLLPTGGGVGGMYLSGSTPAGTTGNWMKWMTLCARMVLVWQEEV